MRSASGRRRAFLNGGTIQIRIQVSARVRLYVRFERLNRLERIASEYYTGRNPDKLHNLRVDFRASASKLSAHFHFQKSASHHSSVLQDCKFKTEEFFGQDGRDEQDENRSVIISFVTSGGWYSGFHPVHPVHPVQMNFRIDSIESV